MKNTLTARQSMIVAGILQGVAMIALHEWFRGKGFAAADLPWAAPAYVLVLLVPFTFGFLRGEFGVKRSLIGAVTMAVPIAAAGAWVGWSRAVGGHWAQRFWFDETLAAFVASVLAVWYLALPLLQSALRGAARTLPYDRLFNDAWRNTMLIGNCLSFTSIFWLLLGLWAGLFYIIDMKFFQDLFTSRFFVYLATALAVSTAISLEDREAAALEALKRHLLTFQTRLLPLASLIVILFLCALLISGLEPLWKTGHATPLMLGLQGFVIMLANAAWQDGTRPAPFSAPVQWLIRMALALLPVLAALCAWSLSLRVSQYGWTSDRVWAAALVALMALYDLGYAYCAVRRGWLPGFGRINTALILTTVALLLALHTPLLDPARIAASSQVTRLLSGATDPEKFHFDYLRFTLGRSGQNALETLAGVTDHPQASGIRAKATLALAKTSRHDPGTRTVIDRDTLAQRLRVYPAGTQVPPELVDHFLERLKSDTVDFNVNGLRTRTEAVLLAVDLGESASPEFVVMFHPYPVFSLQNGAWRQVGTMNFGTLPSGKVTDALERGDFGTALRPWKELRLGGGTATLIPTPPLPAPTPPEKPATP